MIASMGPEGLLLQPRGPYHFDRWQWPVRITTRLGELTVELSTYDDDPSPPDEAMAALASELADFVAANGEMLLDLIYGHYRHAEENNRLSFWGVPSGVSRDRILSQVRSITLAVSRNRKRKVALEAAVFVDPDWDPEHKLDLLYEAGRIVAVNGDAFALVSGVLNPRNP